ncbi:MAG: hypothetical protein ACOCUS_02195 [Polyangiales bacterium]
MDRVKYARDDAGRATSLAHWKWGSRRELAVGAEPVRSSEAIDEHLVFVQTTETVHFRMGGEDVVASTADPKLGGGAVYAFPRAAGETHLSAVLAADADGGEARLEYWLGDRFVEV